VKQRELLTSALRESLSLWHREAAGQKSGSRIH